MIKENLCGVMIKVLNCSLEVSKFEIQLRDYLLLRTNTLGKGMNFLNLPSYGLNFLNNSWKQHPTKQQLHGHLPPISKTISK